MLSFLIDIIGVSYFNITPIFFVVLKIDFSNKICSINLLNEKLLTEINLLDLEIVDKDDNITIIYKLDEDEINKLVISLKE